MKGLNFFKSKTNNETDTYSKIEKLIGFELPKYFKLFASLYELGEGNVLLQKYFNSKFSSYSDCGLIIFTPSQNEEYNFSGFFNNNELLNDWEVYSSDSHEFLEHGLIRIADVGIGGGIFIGTRDENEDKIFLVNWSKSEDYCLIANNIFEFSKTLMFKEEKTFLPNEVSYSELYKNWGEDFWRIRE
ncbi:hypothetical protein [Tenacibaculum amylolyticum]|uniref:hypothetical protein n=1 Tax=Tenacibaculum amylolyticum TaxID=104269 RepID=UPI0038948306